MLKHTYMHLNNFVLMMYIKQNYITIYFAMCLPVTGVFLLFLS